MLVLSRKQGERVRLRHRITGEILGWVTVMECNGRNRLGFEFGPDIEILRDNLAEPIVAVARESVAA